MQQKIFILLAVSQKINNNSSLKLILIVGFGFLKIGLALTGPGAVGPLVYTLNCHILYYIVTLQEYRTVGNF